MHALCPLCVCVYTIYHYRKHHFQPSLIYKQKYHHNVFVVDAWKMYLLRRPQYHFFCEWVTISLNGFMYSADADGRGRTRTDADGRGHFILIFVLIFLVLLFWGMHRSTGPIGARPRVRPLGSPPPPPRNMILWISIVYRYLHPQKYTLFIDLHI